MLLALIGAVMGLIISQLILHFATLAFPSVPFATPLWAQGGSIGIAVLTAVLFALAPARKAAAMAPVDALQNTFKKDS